MDTIKVLIYGAAGRMGRRLVAMTLESSVLQLVGAVDSPAHPDMGQDAASLAGLQPCGILLRGDLPQQADVDVVIDFSLPMGTRKVLNWCVANKIAVVIGTTGLSDSDEAALDEAAKSVPILKASNFSLVVNVLNRLAAQAAMLLGDEYDIEILEAHHRFKKDAPSGTAITLAEHICQAIGRDPKSTIRYDRHGDDVPREAGEITIQALRIGDHVGEHTAFFAALGERLELKHVSTSRDSYVRGALRAAQWLAGREAGRYTMADVLGI